MQARGVACKEAAACYRLLPPCCCPAPCLPILCPPRLGSVFTRVVPVAQTAQLGSLECQPAECQHQLRQARRPTDEVSHEAAGSGGGGEQRGEHTHVRGVPCLPLSACCGSSDPALHARHLEHCIWFTQSERALQADAPARAVWLESKQPADLTRGPRPPCACLLACLLACLPAGPFDAHRKRLTKTSGSV